MILMPDLFSFAYVPNWYSQLDMLAEMALPEPWRFKNPIYLTKNPDTPILERYIHAIFKKQLIDYKEERIPSNAAKFFHIENEFCCFHTGLYTRRYKAIYACFDRNKKKDSMLEWYFRGFADELSPLLRHISPLPEKPSYYMTQYGVNYNPEWPIRVNVDHRTPSVWRLPVRNTGRSSLQTVRPLAVSWSIRVPSKTRSVSGKAGSPPLEAAVMLK